MPLTRAVVFDAYGTLFDVRTLERACTDLVPDPARFVALWRAKQLEYAFQRALMRRYVGFREVTHAALRYAAAMMPVALSLGEETALLEAWDRLAPFPDVEPALQELAERGVAIAILSNGEPEVLARLVAAARLESYFARLLSVDDVRTFKPDPAVYAIAERELGAGREEILFVSANFWDVVGARAFGLRVCWVNRSSVPPDELGLEPDHVVPEMASLPALIEV